MSKRQQVLPNQDKRKPKPNFYLLNRQMPILPFDPREKSEDYITRSEFEAENVNIREQFSKIIDDLDDTLSGQQKINEQVLIALQNLEEKALEALSTLEGRLDWIERTGTKRSETLN